MNLNRQRLGALVFWALIVFLVLMFGAVPYMLPPLLVAIALEVFAFVQVKRAGEAARSRWLLAASILSALTAVLFVVPALILDAFGDRVQSCIAIEQPCDPEDGVNLIGVFLLMYLTGLVSAVTALVAWTIYTVRTLRRPGSKAVQVSRT
jgi:hypothetical protein